MSDVAVRPSPSAPAPLSARRRGGGDDGYHGRVLPRNDSRHRDTSRSVLLLQRAATAITHALWRCIIRASIGSSRLPPTSELDPGPAWRASVD